MSKKTIVNLAVIGAGGRSKHLLSCLLPLSDKIRVKTLFDPKETERAKFLREVPCDARNVALCESYQEAIDRDDIDWVMVFSPNYLHREHAVHAFNAGKNAFVEKPLATHIDDCFKISEAQEKSGKVLFTGFVLRYSPIWRKAKEILDSGKLGKLISVNADENIPPSHGAHIMRCWRRHAALSGSHMLEKCCHDLDLLNWFVGALPSKVASFGGVDFFIPENSGLRKKYRAEDGETSAFDLWGHLDRDVDCPFSSEKTVVDNQVAILQYKNNVRVMFQATLSNAIPERRMYFSCGEGTMIAEYYSNRLQVKYLGEKEGEVFDFSGAGGHGGGDAVIAAELRDAMVDGAPPRTTAKEGLFSAVTALMIDKAREDGQIVDLDPAWAELGVAP